MTQRPSSTFIIAAIIVLALVGLWIILGALEFSLESETKVFEILSQIATIAAIGIAGFWAYTLYVRERTNRSSLDLEQHVVAYRLRDGRFLLKVVVTLKNVSKVEATVVVWRLYASQILPLAPHLDEFLSSATAFPERRAGWLPIAGKEDGVFRDEDVNWVIEPGQTERQIGNLIVPAGVEVVQVYSLFQLVDDPKAPGFPARTLVDLRTPQEVTNDDRSPPR